MQKKHVNWELKETYNFDRNREGTINAKQLCGETGEKERMRSRVSSAGLLPLSSAALWDGRRVTGQGRSVQPDTWPLSAAGPWLSHLDFHMAHLFVFLECKNFPCKEMQNVFISSNIECVLADSIFIHFLFLSFWCEIIGFLSSCRQQCFLIKMLWNALSKVIKTFEKYIKILSRT